MRPQNLNIFSYKLWIYGSLILLIIWLAFWKYKNHQMDIKYSKDCAKEKEMSFQGVVHNYSTDIFNEESTFTLDNYLDTIKIPRSEKELFIENDDTIIKIKEKNIYIIKKRRENRIDTTQFECK